MKVHTETMGCQMNVLDSEILRSLLASSGMEIVDDARLADVLLYNTCSVQLIQSVADGHGPQVALDPPRNKAQADDKVEFFDNHRDPTHCHLPGQAYVRIMRGCDKFCTYCIVPYVRGPERSRPPEDIIEEVRRLVDAGVTQVTLLGQTVNSYRSGSVGLADLLGRLDGVGGLKRIRFVTSYPGDFDRAIFQAMRDLPKVCEYLHIPAQSGSDNMLRAMGRRYSRGEYDDLIAAARQTVPGIAIVGDFIVGFPGETDEDFAASANLIRQSGYRNSFIFKYSPRPGTTGAKRLADDIPEDVKRSRNRELLAVQQEVSLADNRAIIGQKVEILVEGPSPRANRQPNSQNQLLGRTRTDHIVVFDGAENLAGQYAEVKIIDATALTLFGELNE
jgi:tRNA-2-methylthio-N6-dimethylallyladenosine synthase